MFKPSDTSAPLLYFYYYSWIFHCSSPVKFGIYRKTSTENKDFSDMEVVREVKTVDCRQVPEEDSLLCADSGTCKWYSWVRSHAHVSGVAGLGPRHMQVVLKG